MQCERPQKSNLVARVDSLSRVEDPSTEYATYTGTAIVCDQVLDYTDVGGGFEFCPASEFLTPEFCEGLVGLAYTHPGHPPVHPEYGQIMLSIHNDRKYRRGVITDAWPQYREDSGAKPCLRFKFMVLDPETDQALMRGECLELSIGKFVREDPTAGIFEGQSYDVVQRDPIPNHLSGVMYARSQGSRVDGQYTMLEDSQTPAADEMGEEPKADMALDLSQITDMDSAMAALQSLLAELEASKTMNMELREQMAALMPAAAAPAAMAPAAMPAVVPAAETPDSPASAEMEEETAKTVETPEGEETTETAMETNMENPAAAATPLTAAEVDQMIKNALAGKADEYKAAATKAAADEYRAAAHATARARAVMPIGAKVDGMSAAQAYGAAVTAVFPEMADEIKPLVDAGNVSALKVHMSHAEREHARRHAPISIPSKVDSKNLSRIEQAYENARKARETGGKKTA